VLTESVTSSWVELCRTPSRKRFSRLLWQIEHIADNSLSVLQTRVTLGSWQRACAKRSDDVTRCLQMTTSCYSVDDDRKTSLRSISLIRSTPNRGLRDGNQAHRGLSNIFGSITAHVVYLTLSLEWTTWILLKEPSKLVFSEAKRLWFVHDYGAL